MNARGPITVLDVGGTHVRHAVWSPREGLSGIVDTPSPSRLRHPEAGVEELKGRLLDTICDAVPTGPATVAGISFGAALDQRTGTVYGSAPLFGDETTPLDLPGALRERRPDVEWHVVNDVTAALLHFVSAPRRRGHRKVLLMTVSSGIACRTVDLRTGTIATDACGLQGEVGHLPATAELAGSPVELVCDCGRPGHVASYASGPGLRRMADVLREREPARWQASELGRSMAAGTAFEDALGHALDAGDALAGELLDASTAPVADVLRTALCLDPELDELALTGGVATGLGRHYEASLHRHLRHEGLYLTGERAPEWTTDRITICAPGEANGLIGAGIATLGAGTAGADADLSGADADLAGTGSNLAGTGSNHAGAGSNHPGTGSNHPGAGSNHAGAGSNHPGTGSNHPGTGSNHPGAGSNHPGAGSNHPGTGSNHPGTGSNHAGADAYRAGAGSDLSSGWHHAIVRDHPGRLHFSPRPTPEPGPGELLVAPVVAGVCGTDLQMLRGVRDDGAPVLGHEGVARVVAVGAGVREPRLVPGAHVVVNPTHPTDPSFLLGHNVDGLLQERALIPATAVGGGLVLPLPEVPPGVLGTLIEPLAVVRYAALALSEHRPRTLLVFGDGTVGHLAVRTARRWYGPGVRTVHVHHTRAGLDWSAQTPYAADIRLRYDDLSADAARLADVLGDGPIAVLVATPAPATLPCLELALDATDGADTVVDLVGGLPRPATSPRLPGVDLAAVRAANRAGLPQPPQVARLGTASGHKVRVLGHRGVAGEHLLYAAAELCRAPERYRDLVTHVLDLPGAVPVLTRLGETHDRIVSGRRLIKMAVRMGEPS
ncbi:ROK family protein [Streptomyces sp. AC555_RSS877]|uniref:ROK family protein n=1 Tax=Streptomyces sp. AC555_RSS877 TaxID=2823688 RepID=UPI001C26DB53|nr:ROK family protein [Streptomyces sp. AC555_RSS877]